MAQKALDETVLRRSADEFHAHIQLGPVETPAHVARTTAGADALIVTLQRMRAEHIAALPASVKVIVRAGVGLDTIDVAAAAARGIVVIFQPSYATNEVADHAAAMALAVWRRLSPADARVRSDGWFVARTVGPVRALHEATLGVLGAGRIGRALISRLSPFVSRVVVFDALPDHALPHVDWADSAQDVIRQSDLLSLHLPLTAETRHLVDEEAIASMPDAAVIVNVSRGGLVDEGALAEALTSGRLAGAALDVFEREPLDAESPLRSAPNLLLSPHLAWYSVEAAYRLARWSVEDAVHFVRNTRVIHGSTA